MAIYNGNPGVGLRNTNSYLVPGTVWMTGSTIAPDVEHRRKFPYVTKSLTISNMSATGGANEHTLRVFFASGSEPAADRDNAEHFAGMHYFSLEGGSTLSIDVKCTEVYLYREVNSGTTAAGAGSTREAATSATYQMFAELTGIPSGSMYPLTGSGLTDDDNALHANYWSAT